MFDFNKPGEKPESGYMLWSPFKADTNYFAPSDKPFMINFRVDDLVSLVHSLKEAGVEVLDEIEASEYGKFVHIMDPEGNKIELWEPSAADAETPGV
jgi:predicted enzyme related to lactoylglutathione lyase